MRQWDEQHYILEIGLKTNQKCGLFQAEPNECAGAGGGFAGRYETKGMTGRLPVMPLN